MGGGGGTHLTEQGEKILQVVPYILIRRPFPCFPGRQKAHLVILFTSQNVFVTLKALYIDTEHGLYIHPLTVGF